MNVEEKQLRARGEKKRMKEGIFPKSLMK